jgi:cGMP-dependent protein kinase
MRVGEGGEDIEVAKLGRGQFVGERTLITGKLRSANCVAQVRVLMRSLTRSPAHRLQSPGVCCDTVRAVLGCCV